MGLNKVFIAVLFSVFLFVTPVKADSTTASDIAKQLVCQCGCTMVLASCTHIECHSREAMTNVIEQRLAQGESPDQIISFFVTQYGEQVLSSPPKRGFNLTAWILPFAAILGGGGAIYFMLKKWVRRGMLFKPEVVFKDEEDYTEYQARLEKDLEEFTEESFR